MRFSRHVAKCVCVHVCVCLCVCVFVCLLVCLSLCAPVHGESEYGFDVHALISRICQTLPCCALQFYFLTAAVTLFSFVAVKFCLSPVTCALDVHRQHKCEHVCVVSGSAASARACKVLTSCCVH